MRIYNRPAKIGRPIDFKRCCFSVVSSGSFLEQGAFTLDVYGHVTDQMKQERAARMESYIKDVLNP